MSSAAVQTATMYQYLQTSGLLSEPQLRELRGWIAHKQPDIKALAQELVQRGWLTPFQIKEVAKSRGTGLRIADRYILIDVLGEGGMGRVYKAHDTRMGRDVAFKVIRKEKLKHPAAAGRFIQEVQALGKLGRHPNVVEVYEAAQVGDNHYCVMEYIDGIDLTKIVRDNGPMAIPQACDAIRQAALGLEHAFQTGLVHRDIKPSNIIVPRTIGTVKLVDLGLARVMDTTPEDAHRITQEGFVIGTPDFLAPEQARDPMSVDIRADIYALGGTLFYILTGRVPYETGSATEKLLRHCTDPPPNLLDFRREAPASLQQLIHWCMAKRAQERPQTPLQLAVALQPFCPPPPPGTGVFSLGSGLHAAPPDRQMVPSAAPAYPPVNYPPAYSQPAVPQAAVADPPVAEPVYEPADAPTALHDPNPSSQVFKLPPQSNDSDPIRKRGEAKFPVGLVLFLLGGLLAASVIGLAAFLMFFRPDSGPPEPFTNSANMKMVKLEGGKFRMGSPENEAGRRPDEGPVRDVTIRDPFFMAATEVTIGQYFRVMGVYPAKSIRAKNPDQMPVEFIAWEDANEFCRKLTEKERDQPWMRQKWAYRLPTEAEWEYACRGGTEAPFASGDRLAFKKQAMYQLTPDGTDPYEIGDKPDEAIRFAQSVGKTEANKFGLYDMHGNVAEWCSDWYKSEAYKDAARENPTGPADGDRRVVRGGSFRDPASTARSAARDSQRPSEPSDRIGFRVVYAPITK